MKDFIECAERASNTMYSANMRGLTARQAFRRAVRARARHVDEFGWLYLLTALEQVSNDPKETPHEGAAPVA